jgi:PAS domain S-box-containing protein
MPLRSKAGYALLAVPVAYYFGATLGVALTPQPHPISTLWPPNAILLAALLLSPPKSWWAVLLAALPAHLLVELPAGVPFPMVLSWYVSNCIEALIGAAAIYRIGRGRTTIDGFQSVAIFVAGGVLLAPFASSFLDAAFVRLNNWGAGTYWEVWRVRFFSNMLATVTIVPPILWIWRQRWAPLRAASLLRLIEAATLTVSLVAVCLFVFDLPRLAGGEMPVLVYAPFVLLIWTALRFGPEATSGGVLIVTLVSTWGLIHGRGPFISNDIDYSVVSLQVFLLVMAVPLLALAGVLRERERSASARVDEAALGASDARFRELANAMPQIVFSATPDGEVDYFNEKWYDLTLKPRGPVTSQSWVDVVHPSDVIAALDRWNADVAAQRPHDAEIRLRDTRTGKYRWHLVRALPVRDWSGAVRRWYGTATDIDDHKRIEGALRAGETALRDLGERLEQRVAERTAELSHANASLQEQIEVRVRAEKALRALERQLAHLGRVSMLGELAGALAHEVNQPLTAILANARAAERIISRDGVEHSELDEILRDIISDNLRAGAVIRRVRSVIRKGDVDMQPVMANDIVNEVLELTHSDMILREVTVTTHLSTSLPLVPVDRVQFQQVLLNLIMNACDAMAAIPASERILVIRTRRDAGAIRISVRDSGTGRPAANPDSVFEPFVTSKADGLGLGLAICRSIVRAHRGRLWAVNNKVRGATFHVLFPLTQEQEYMTPPRPFGVISA